ncbi:MAG: hypothetical protein SGJ01_15140 [Gemmatimonadota bacterium]|nr:hypothetical protein [Gemmatimonadota bacterium]
MTTPTEPTPAAPAAAPRRARRWGRRALLLLVGLLLLMAVYTWLALHWDYSNGYRSGTMQKFSKRGWVCKTYEGELWQSVVTNVSPQVWQFSVRDERVVQALDSLVGRQVRLHYTEHRGVPTSCFADTPYYVDSVVVISP